MENKGCNAFPPKTGETIQLCVLELLLVLHHGVLIAWDNKAALQKYKLLWEFDQALKMCPNICRLLARTQCTCTLSSWTGKSLTFLTFWLQKPVRVWEEESISQAITFLSLPLLPRYPHALFAWIRAELHKTYSPVFTWNLVEGWGTSHIHEFIFLFSNIAT